MPARGHARPAHAGISEDNAHAHAPANEAAQHQNSTRARERGSRTCAGDSEDTLPLETAAARRQRKVLSSHAPRESAKTRDHPHPDHTPFAITHVPGRPRGPIACPLHRLACMRAASHCTRPEDVWGRRHLASSSLSHTVCRGTDLSHNASVDRPPSSPKLTQPLTSPKPRPQLCQPWAAWPGVASCGSRHPPPPGLPALSCPLAVSLRPASLARYPATDATAAYLRPRSPLRPPRP